ncbi:hypothetical protein [Duganella vulcania]|nr:hypothetical protein [Duganella vulcania]
MNANARGMPLWSIDGGPAAALCRLCDRWLLALVSVLFHLH